MQNKKRYIVFAIVIVVVAAAAFVGGRLLNGQIGVPGFFALGNGGRVQVSIKKIPAAELPTTKAALTGLFFKRDDNTITLQSTASMAIKVVKGGDGAVNVSPADGSDGPKVEVVVTNQTKIWRDTTELNGPPASGEMTVQQTVGPGSLDDLNGQTMVMVWGRKNGDRVIADVISYSNPVMIQK